MEQKTRWGNWVLDGSYTIIPNILFDKQKDLDITDQELLFILKISRHKDSFYLHDEKISDKSRKTMWRRRDSLEKKGYLKYIVRKEKEDSEWTTKGITYDLSGLSIALQNLSETESRQECLEDGQICPSNETKTSPQKKTNYKTNKEDYGQAQKASKKKLPESSLVILNRYSEEYTKRRSIPYRPNGASWNLLYNPPEELFKIVIERDDALKKKGIPNVWERWFSPTTDDFISNSDRGLAVMFHAGTFDKFWHGEVPKGERT